MFLWAYPMKKTCNRPYVTCSIAISLDGHIDDLSEERLILSNMVDLKEINRLRVRQDAILVGAETIRRDNPKLVPRAWRSASKKSRQAAATSPKKVTITGSGKLKASASFFRIGRAEKVVYHSKRCARSLRSRLSKVASLVEFPGKTAKPEHILADLYERGVRLLLIEGGQKTNTLFINSGLVDEIRVAIAPFFVAENAAPRFVRPGSFLANRHRPFKLISIKRLKDMAILRYRPCDLPKLP